MLTTSTSVALGIGFVLLGGINIWLVLEAWSRVKAAQASSRMLSLHRIGGYLFIAIFCLMAYFMVARLRSGGTDTSPTVTLHLALAMILSPLLFVKVLIARYYKNQHGLLLPLGLTIFVLAFVLIASTVGPYLARGSRIEEVAIDSTNARAVAIDVGQAGDLMQKRCSRCHNLDRVVGARKDAPGWIATVNRMRAMPGAGISESDVQTIVTYLVTQEQPKGPAAAAKLQVARALVDQRCGRCHSLDRVYKAVESPKQWREIVTRMVGYAAGSTGALQPGEDQKITEYLSTTQTPEAVAQRRAEASAAATSGRSLIPQPDSLPPAPARRAKRYDRTTIGFISLVSLAAAALAAKRPGSRATVAPSKLAPQSGTAQAASPRMANAPLVLELVRITPQTHDSKTLRFAVHGSRKCEALPGQFLAFSFLFDGKKETRCYSICSSPARSGYVEITPKRTNNGCVSVFLNDRAFLGMTVEATGPTGQFCFDRTLDRNIVLIAAGSGVTPMLSILRYIEDLSLDTRVTLLYCVRTSSDIMFREELDELQSRLKNFRCSVMLSQPSQDWPGAGGHISGKFISAMVPDVRDRLFFLCGPPPFMQLARQILAELGVEAGRIRQETFGGASTGHNATLPSVETGFSIEFVNSGKSCTILEGQTLLEAAAGAGVAIPSACRQGQCGTCKTRLLAGNVSMAAEQGLDPESKDRGFVLTCVGRANGNVRLEA